MRAYDDFNDADELDPAGGCDELPENYGDDLDQVGEDFGNDIGNDVSEYADECDDGHYDDDPNPYFGTYNEDDCANDGNECDPYEWGDGSEDSRFDYDEY